MCRWCGNDVGTAEYVEADIDERKILDDYLKSQKKDDVLGTLFLIPLLLFGVGSIVYKLIVGSPVAWWLWILGSICAIMLMAMPFVIKDARMGKKAIALRKLFADNNYSLAAIADAIPKLEAEADALKKSDIDKASELRELTDSLKEFVLKAYSGVSIKQQYSQGDRHGLKADESASVADVPVARHAHADEERILYIVPPTHCPACNYAYRSQDFDGNATTVTCPHCTCEIDIMHKSVRTETQAMIRDYFVNNKKFKSKGGSIALWVMCIIFLAVSIFTIVGSGPEKFFFSARPLWPVMALMFLAFYIHNIKKQKTLVEKVKNGFTDIFELEVFIKSQASLMEDDFNELKMKIVKNLQKQA